MIWQNPWAFAGLVAIAIPVLIHLLSRRTARVERFPTLRFLTASPSAPVRFTRITDPLLLIVRALILAIAVAALAQPLWKTANRTAATERQIVRAVVLDTSASMRAVADSARRAAAALASAASLNLVIPTANPAAVLRGASSWLSGQAGRREIIIVSDFQESTIDSVDLRAVASGIAVQFHRVAASNAAGAGAGSDGGITLLTPPGSRAGADAALRAASPVGFDTSATSVVIAYPGAQERSALIGDAKPVTDARIGDAVVRVRRDPLLAAAMNVTVDHADTSAMNAQFMRVTNRVDAHAAVYAAQGRHAGRDALLLLPSFDAGTLQSAALIAAVARALSSAPSPAEAAPRAIPDETLAAWRRDAETKHTNAGDSQGASDGRWLWLAVLILLVVESWLRRRPAAGMETAHAG